MIDLERVLPGRVTCSVIFQPRLWAARVDASRIDQTILNLVINAREALPKGGTPAIETRNSLFHGTSVDEQLEIAPGECTRLTVADTGAVMDEDTRSKIFEPFFTTKGEDGRTGLGPAVVRDVVRDARGDIWAVSEPGKDPTFEILIPRAAEGRGAA